ncbi:MAG: hypothetical protein WCO45_01275 [Pseudanabaena sp. ELA607]
MLKSVITVRIPCDRYHSQGLPCVTAKNADSGFDLHLPHHQEVR